MKRRGSIWISGLLMLVLLLALAPAAFADGTGTCICTSAREMNPACTCGCNGTPEMMRENALRDFLTATMAAETEADIRARAALYDEAARLWDSYMDLAAVALEAEAAAEDANVQAQSIGVIGSSDGPTYLYVTGSGSKDAPGRHGHRPQPFDVPAYEAYEEVFGQYEPFSMNAVSPADKALNDFLMCMAAAREETDPALQYELYIQAKLMLNDYLYLMFGPDAQMLIEAYAAPWEAEPQPDPYEDMYLAYALTDAAEDAAYESAPVPAEEEPDIITLLRRKTLEDYVTHLLAAEDETDPARQDELRAYAELLWDDYVHMLLLDTDEQAEPPVQDIYLFDAPADVPEAVNESAPAPAAEEPDAVTAQRRKVLMDYVSRLMAAEEETDPARQAELRADAELLWNDYVHMLLTDSDEQAEAPAQETPAAQNIYLSDAPTDAPETVNESAPAATEEKPDAVTAQRRKVLMDYVSRLMAAEEETDPARQAELRADAEMLREEYVHMLLTNSGEQAEAPAQESPAAQDIYLSDAPADVPEDAAVESASVLETVEELDTVTLLRRKLLQDYMTRLVEAEEETDPDKQANLRATAEMLRDSYMRMLLLDTDEQAEPAAQEAIPQEIPTEDDDASNMVSDAILDSYNALLAGYVGLPNPWTETELLNEAIRVSGVESWLPTAEGLPQGMELMWYRAVPGTLEADYTNGDAELMIRASSEDEGYDLSGDYNSYSHEWLLMTNGIVVDCLGDGNHANIAMFKIGDTAYAMTMACGEEGRGLTADEIDALVKALISAPETPAADIYAEPTPEQSLPAAEPAVEKNGEIVVLFTGNALCGIDEGFGYAGLKSLRDSLEAEGYTTVLADGGNAVAGEDIGTLSRGEAIIDFMNALDYDVAVPGVHEADYGMEQLLKLMKDAEFPYVSADPALAGEVKPYVILTVEGKNIAFIGAGDSPDYAALQNAIDSARNEGAEFVYMIGHANVIANTTGVDVLLCMDNVQGVLRNKAGRSVECVPCGAKLSGVAYSVIDANGFIVENGILSWEDNSSSELFANADNDIADMVQSARQKLAQLNGSPAVQ